jgi:hypothetical protein
MLAFVRSTVQGVQGPVEAHVIFTATQQGKVRSKGVLWPLGLDFQRSINQHHQSTPSTNTDYLSTVFDNSVVFRLHLNSVDIHS